MALQQQPQQPDFAVISDGFTVLSEQFRRCAHLPAVDQGAHVLEVLQEVRAGVLALRQEMGEVRQQLHRMSNQIRAVETNSSARTENATVTRDNEPLEPLRDISTGNEIPNFPPTISAIATTQARVLEQILEALGKPTAGPIAEKRTRLMLAIGVVHRRVA